MKRLFILAFILVLMHHFSIAQYYENKKEEKPPIKERIFFGGGFGLQFGTVTQVEVSPIIGYRLTKRLQAGIGITYSYYNDKRFTPAFDFSTYGGSVFSRFFILDNIFAHAEIEALNTEVFNIYLETDRRWIDNYYIGGGFYQRFGPRSGVAITILYNLNYQNGITPSSNPVIRIGFNF